MTTDKKKPAGTDFEKSVKALEAIVEAMESKPLTLDEALTHFENGVSLSKSCQAALNQAELKIKTITQSEQNLEKNND